VAHIDDDVDFDDPGLKDFQERLGRLRAKKGLVRLRYGSMTNLTLLRHADVARGFRDEEHFSKAKSMRRLTFPFMGPHLVGFDGEEHTVKRALVTPTFKRTMIPRYIDPILRPVAEQLVDEIAAVGEADLMTTFAKKYPLRIITRLLGLPVENEDTMTGWVKGMFGMHRDPDGARRANAEFTDYVAPLIDDRRSHPGEDLLSAIANEEVDGQHLDDEEIFGFLRLLFPAGVDTTALTLGNVMFAVLQHPEIHSLLIENEEERLWAVEETLRWEPTVASDEHSIVKDVEVDGILIPAGEEVRLAVASANRDPVVFADPDTWDLARRPRNHLSFGLGRHFCLGAHLARAELQIAIEVLLRRLTDVRLVGEPWISGSGLRGPKTLRIAWNTA
jgi:cytochrome P450